MPTRAYLTSAAALLFVVGTAAPVTAAEPLGDGTLAGELDAVAKRIAAKAGAGEIKIGFILPESATDDATSGTSLRVKLQELLKRRGSKVELKTTPNTQYVVTGKFGPKTDAPAHLKMDFELLSPDGGKGKRLDSFGTYVIDERDVATILQSTFHAPPGLDRKGRDDAIAKGAKKPSVYIDGTKVRAHRDSPYAIQVEVAGKAKKVIENGHAHTDELVRGDKYDLRIFNDSADYVLATITIDGVNVFQFADASVRDEKGQLTINNAWAIAPGSSMLLKGWFINTKQIARFEVAGADESVGVVLPADVEQLIGRINVTFVAAWENANDVPTSEKRVGGGAGPEGLGTKKSNEVVAANVKMLQLHPGRLVRAGVTVQYSTEAKK